MQEKFLPVTMKQCEELGWDRPDFVYVLGDAYVDHPSFGPAIISRILEKNGYKVAILPQPDWKNINEFKRFGRPKYAFLVCSGNIDPMVNHYTAAHKRRSTDAYSPGGKIGMRPDRADIVYCNCIRQAYKNMPIIIGGVEASLRRFAHYDCWDNKVRASILVDSGADLLLYGMGERSIVEVADALAGGIPIKEITYVNGSAYLTENPENVFNGKIIDSFEDVKTDKDAYCRAFMEQYREQNHVSGKTLIQKHGKSFVAVNPPSSPLSQREMDEVYALPYTRLPHPMYDTMGGIPAIKEIEFSITANRGCAGACSFCAITFHQGRVLQSRSEESIIEEAKLLTELKGFKGYIHDVGGPTANFYAHGCKTQKEKGACKERQCLYPSICPQFKPDHKQYMELLDKLRKLPKVKKVFVRSGLRFDCMLADKKYGQQFLRELCQYHVSGQLKVAPEHISDKVLRLMGKPGEQVYNEFCDKYKQMNAKLGKEQYLVPYLISGHPGSDLKEAVKLAEYLHKHKINPEQVQEFYPTPGTLATCMFYTEKDPRTNEKIYVAKDISEKIMQRALLQYKKPENYETVKKALIKAGRQDLIGFGPQCLIKPREIKNNGYYGKKDNKKTVSAKGRVPQNKSNNRQKNKNGRNK
ncbi:MAG: YgiQ family radical SAM protein [Clostridia bacterium]|nr:YgiQ family radical SAM protein [Clostridia bacterium]